jgi:hypothetical protein
MKCAAVLGPYFQTEDREIKLGSCPSCESKGPFQVRRAAGTEGWENLQWARGKDWEGARGEAWGGALGGAREQAWEEARQGGRRLRRAAPPEDLTTIMYCCTACRSTSRRLCTATTKRSRCRRAPAACPRGACPAPRRSSCCTTLWMLCGRERRSSSQVGGQTARGQGGLASGAGLVGWHVSVLPACPVCMRGQRAAS